MVVRLTGATAVVAAVVAMSSSAGASTSAGWLITKWTGNTFAGTFTNETASPINGIAVGTADKAKNPITAFEINNIVCQLYANYGSAYCYTALLIQPGATVLFHGASMHALTPAGLQMCSSADKGMDNTCTDVALKASTTIAVSSKARKQQAALAFEEVLVAIRSERNALDAIDKGDLVDARNQLVLGMGDLDHARGRKFDAADIAGDLRSARQDDLDAWHDLKKVPPEKGPAKKLIDKALGDKHIAALDLNHISHS